MSRPLRIEFAGALHHITSRGNARQDIYVDDADRERFMAVLAEACEQYRWRCHAYCLMSNHYHLLVETLEATLSAGMRAVNGVYTQSYNCRHSRVGHLFQGRFKAILVERESYLLELARYIVLNPVRARMVRCASEWPWSSYRATAALCPPHPFLSPELLLGFFGTRLESAVTAYVKFVAAGNNQPSPWDALQNQVFLGSSAFVEEMQRQIDPDRLLDGVPAYQRRAPPRPIEDFVAMHASRDLAMSEAYRSGHFTLRQIADHFGLSTATVSRVVRTARRVATGAADPGLPSTRNPP
jgi:REP element-mobilizing transposase RayT